jgi:hypothetical protein
MRWLVVRCKNDIQRQFLDFLQQFGVQRGHVHPFAGNGGGRRNTRQMLIGGNKPFDATKFKIKVCLSQYNISVGQ